MRKQSITINWEAAGGRLREIRERRLEGFKKKFREEVGEDKVAVRRMCRNQEEEDYHAMGYNNRRYLKAMQSGRPITDGVLTFYSEACEVSKDWILYGTLFEHLYYVMNPYSGTVSYEDCIRLEAKVSLEGIGYGEREEYLRLAQELGIVPLMHDLSNLVDIYDEGERGRGFLLLLFNKETETKEQKIAHHVINGFLSSANAKRTQTLTYEEVYLDFVDKFLRKMDKELQNRLGILGAVRVLMTDLDIRGELTQAIVPEQRQKLLRHLNKMSLLAQAEIAQEKEVLRQTYGIEDVDEAAFPYVKKILRLLSLFAPSWDKKKREEDLVNIAPPELEKEEFLSCFDFSKINSQCHREKSELLLDSCLTRIEKQLLPAS